MASHSYYIATMAFILVFTLIAGCDEIPDSAPRVDGTISLRGIDRFTTESGNLTIMVPAPVYRDSLVPIDFQGAYFKGAGSGYFAREQYNDGRVSMRNVVVNGSPMIAVDIAMTGQYQIIGYVEDKYQGVMRLNVTAVNKSGKSFDNVSITGLYGFFGRPNSSLEERSAMMAEMLENCPVRPVANASETKYTVPEAGDVKKTYVSYVYIDEGLRPVESGNSSIEIKMSLYYDEGRVNQQYGKRYYLAIHEIIPAGVTGFVPVSIQYVRAMDSGYT